jgi:hypothetical protein
MNIIVVVLVINCILSLLVGNEGSKKEIGSTKAFLLSFLFSPIIGMLFVINSKELSLQVKKEDENIEYNKKEDENIEYNKSASPILLIFALIFIGLLVIAYLT